MSTIRVESFDAVFAAIRDQHQQLDAQVEDWQLLLKPGDYVLRIWHPPLEGAVAMYYEILEPWANDHPLPHNCRLIRGYSFICPQGESGIEHIATFNAKLPKSVFDMARENGWPMLALTDFLRDYFGSNSM